MRMANLEDLNSIVEMNSQLEGYKWTKEKFTELFNHQVPIILACDKENGEIIGFLACILVLDELRVLNVSILPMYRNQKIAENLMYASMNYSLEYNCRYALLEVNTNNRPALNLYKKLGFSILCLRVQYYEDFTDAYFMELVYKQIKIPPVYISVLD
jgi:ribosomal-protein-alanine N-acetyltransferase